MLLGNYLGRFLYLQRLVLCRLAAAARGVKMSDFYLNIKGKESSLRRQLVMCGGGGGFSTVVINVWAGGSHASN